MQIGILKAVSRQPGGRHANERLRRSGYIPAVIYGHDETPETVAVSRHDLLLALEHAQHVVDLDLDGATTRRLIKDVQRDHLHKDPIHVDFLRVDADERVTVRVALRQRGEPHSVHEGGELVTLMAEIEVECGLTQIPDEIVVKIDQLGIGDAVHVRDLTFPEGVVPVDPPDEIVALVRAKRGLEVEEAAAVAESGESATAQPEVIGRVAKSEENEGD